MRQIVPLEALAVGETGQVCEIWGCQNLVTRLSEMGFGEGKHVRMVQTGRPCIVAIEDQRLSFRGEENVEILVEVQHNHPTL